MTTYEIGHIIKYIEDPAYTVMWNDGKDKYVILEKITRKENSEVYASFQGVRGYIDLYNVTLGEMKVYKSVLC